MIPKEMACPACKKAHPPGEFKHDEKLNLLCSGCGIVVFAVTEEEEERVKALYSSQTQSTSFNSYNPKKQPVPISMGVLPTITKEEPAYPDEYSLYG